VVRVAKLEFKALETIDALPKFPLFVVASYVIAIPKGVAFTRELAAEGPVAFVDVALKL
jgi:hypothetical protein